MTTDRERLPEAANRAVEELRRLEPPAGVLDAVMREAAATPQRRPWAFPAALGFMGAAATVLLVATLVLPRLLAPGPGAGASSTGLPIGGAVAARVAIPAGSAPGSADDRWIWIGDSATGRITRIDARAASGAGEVQVSPATTEAYSLWPVSDGTAVWASGRDDRSIVRIDAASLDIQSRWPIDALAYRIVPAGDTLWVSDFDGDRVLRVATTDGQVLGSVDLPSPTGIAVTPAAVYVVGYLGDFAAIDPTTLEIVGRGRISGRATDVLVVDGAALVWGIDGRPLERVGAASATVTASRPGVTGVALLDGEVWAAIRGGTLVRLDAASLEPLATVALGDVDTDQLIASRDRLWAYAGTPEGTYLYAVEPED